MKLNISKFLIICIFFIFSEYEIVKAKTDEEVFLGNKDAKIVVIEYASMTCAHCANFHKKVYPKIKENYIDTNKIKFIFSSLSVFFEILFILFIHLIFIIVISKLFILSLIVLYFSASLACFSRTLY